MKKIMFFLAVFLIGGWSSSVRAQDVDIDGLLDDGGGGGGNFFFSLGPGVAFSAPGRNISADRAMPTIAVSVGGKAKEILLFGVSMRGLTPYSPASRDSSFVQKEGDSAFYYRRFFEKSAVLVGSFGLHSGGYGGLGGGMFTSGGVTFMEKGNKIYTPFVWELTLEGEYGFGEAYSVAVSSTYSYVFSHYIRRFGTDGFAVILEIKFKYQF